MLTTQSPLARNHFIRPKSGRQPLQPIRSPVNLPAPPINNSYQKPNSKAGWIDCNKENPNPNRKPNLNANLNQNSSSICPVAAAPVQIEQFEVSLAEELSAIREKMESLRLDREKTEDMLKERELMMERKMKELNQRGEIQKVLEIEVDRLYRMNELRSLCNRILPIRSQREKEQEKIKPDKSQGEKAGKHEEGKEEKISNPCGIIDSEK